MTKKELYESRKAQGICIQCGKAPAYGAHVTCKGCAERNRELARIRYLNNGISEKRKREKTEWRKQKYAKNIANGVCGNCEGPLMQGSNCLCEKCYERNRAYKENKRRELIMEAINEQ